MTTQPKENEISGDIVDAAYKVHTRLGLGLLESVYEAVLAHELLTRGHRVERQVPIGFRYDDLEFDIGFRADLVVDGLVIIELKSVEHLLPVHKKQLLTYVRLTNKRLGLLLDCLRPTRNGFACELENFGANRIDRTKEGITRLVNDLPE